jgi:hypothetical protein
MKRILLLLALAIPAAHAQVQTTAVAPALEVQRLAPQLVGFAGGDVNFANLVNGLALGVPVTLTTPLATGGMQVFTFTPAGTMSSVQIAQVLESARQSLIARGIATPSAQQLGTTLAGGTLATAVGATPVNALVNTASTPSTLGASAAAVQSPANAIQNANSTVNATSAAAGSSAAPRNMSDSPLPRGIADTPPLPVPGVTSPAPTTSVEPAARIGVAPGIVAPTITSPLRPMPAVRAGER